jgi:hypothetical protein
VAILTSLLLVCTSVFRKHCPSFSSNHIHNSKKKNTGHLVSRSMLRCLIFILQGRLLCLESKHHVKQCLIFVNLINPTLPWAKRSVVQQPLDCKPNRELALPRSPWVKKCWQQEGSKGNGAFPWNYL